MISTTIILSIFLENPRILDITNSQVMCQYGNEKQFLIKEIFGKDEIPSALPNYYNDATRTFSEKIIKSCSIDEVITRSTQPNGFIPDPYRIEKQYKKNIVMPLVYSLLSLIIMTILFEIIRRTFYYIVLGTIRPKK